MALATVLLPIVPTASAVDSIENRPSLATLALPNFQPAPPPPDLRLKLVPVASGLEQPIWVTAAPGSDRLFILERKGRIRVVENGDVRLTPFLDLTAEIDWAGERGLLGLAFSPDYAESRRFYVAYTDRQTFDTVIARYESSEDFSSGNPQSREEILRIPQPADQIDHKAGWIGFRPGDSKCLFIATGDGGGSNDRNNHAQNLQSRLGKILRVDVSGYGPGFEVPTDNPFVSREDADQAIWAYGLRNPYRPSFDRATGDLYIADVGQDSREEINFEESSSIGGRNYGWRLREGAADNTMVEAATPPDLVDPILDYAHGSQMTLRGCVIGGFAYRGKAIPALQGTYFFGEFPNAQIYSFRYDGREVSALTNWTPQLNADNSHFAYSGMPSFGEDNDGELYFCDLGGAVYRLSEDATP